MRGAVDQVPGKQPSRKQGEMAKLVQQLLGKNLFDQCLTRYHYAELILIKAFTAIFSYLCIVSKKHFTSESLIKWKFQKSGWLVMQSSKSGIKIPEARNRWIETVVCKCAPKLTFKTASSVPVAWDLIVKLCCWFLHDILHDVRNNDISQKNPPELLLVRYHNNWHSTFSLFCAKFL